MPQVGESAGERGGETRGPGDGRLGVLLVADSADAAARIERQLLEAGFEPSLCRAHDPTQLLGALSDSRQAFDLALSANSLQGFDGATALGIVRAEDPDLPFVVVTDAVGEEAVAELMRQGATDCLRYDNPDGLARVVRRELHEAQTRRDGCQRQVRVERARAARLSCEQAIEMHPDAILVCEPPEPEPSHCAWRVVLANAAAASIAAVARSPVGQTVSEAFGDHGASQLCEILARAHSRRTAQRLTALRFVAASDKGRGRAPEPGDEARCFDVSALPLTTKQIVVFLQDVTDRRRLEDQIRASQRLEAIGRLAGGVAHDFNNTLTAVLSFATFALEELSPDHAAYEDITQVVTAGKRAERLTRQLLAFSRRRVVAPRTLSINSVVNDMLSMLQRLVGETVQLRSELADLLWNTCINLGALEQVVANLVVNGRDAAFATKGTIVLRTRNISRASTGYVGGVLVEAGEYVELSVTDDGEGMTEDVARQIFEPFFTTKSAGKGTGLGLATCHAMVDQAGGHMRVETAVGVGTTMSVHLPRVLDEVDAPTKRPARAATGTEVILLAEDDDVVRELAVRALRAASYRVLEAADGEQAVRLSSEYDGEIDLLLTDMVMPRMSGRELCRSVRAQRPSVRVVYMSGYDDGGRGPQLESDVDSVVVDKPFTPEVLRSRVREGLETPATPPDRLALLLVDDDERFLRASKRLLSEFCDVTMLSDPTRMAHLIQRHHFDVVLCDLHMPELDGGDVYRVVRETNPQLADGFFFMSGDPGSETLREVLGRSGRPLIAKPLNASEILARIVAHGPQR